MHPSGGDVDGGEVVHMWGQKVYEKFLYFSLNFAGNQKLLFLKKGRVGGSFKEKLKKNFFFF